MKVLSIFIASSFELSADRIAIGDIILRISEKILQSKYIYVRMLCWEDYDPTYIGIPTQKGYDEDLIKKSQVIITLFKTRCGMYTQGEISLGRSLGIPIEYIQRQTEELQTDDLKDYLNNNSLSPRLYKDISELENLIHDIILKYLIKSIDIADIPSPTYKLGSIVQCRIKYDFDKAESFVSSQSFNNIIRQLNEIAFGYGYGRIGLLETYDANICDTLVACFHDKVDTESEKVLDEAAKHIKKKDSKLRQLNIFFYQDSNGYLPEVESYNNKLMNDDSWKYFPVPYKNQDTVKMYLFRLLINNTLSLLGDFSLSGFVLQYKNQPIADVRNLPFLENGLKEVERLCTQIDTVKKKAKSCDSILKQHDLQKQLQNKVLFALNSWVLAGKQELEQLNEENKLLEELYHEKNYDEIINITKLENVPMHIRQSEVAQEIIENRKEILEQDITTIEYRIKALQEKKYSLENAEAIVECYDRIVDILHQLSIRSLKYRKILFHQCNALCLFADNGIVISNYDRYYEYQIEILEIDKELMQEVTFNGYLALEANLLNGYNGNQKWSDGDNLIEKIKKQLGAFDNKNASEESLILMVHIMNCITSYYGNKGNITQASLYQIKAESYQDNLIKLDRKRYLSSKLMTITNCLLNYYRLNKWQEIGKYIIEGDQLIKEVDSNIYYIDNRWYADKTHYYRTVASIYYEIENIRNEKNSEHYFKLGYEAVEHIKDTNPGIYWEMKSDLYHNHAFMLTHFHDFILNSKVAEKIIEEYKAALSLREMLAKHNNTYGIVVAQTMVNIGDIHRVLHQFDKAERYASEAKSKYKQFLSENVISTIDHFNQAHLLYVTTLRDKAFYKQDIVEFNSMMNEIKELKTWAIKHKDEIEYYDTIIIEDSISQKMATKFIL